MPHDHAFRLDFIRHHDVIIASEANEAQNGFGRAYTDQTSSSIPHEITPVVRFVSIVNGGEKHLNVALGIHPVVMEKDISKRAFVDEIVR